MFNESGIQSDTRRIKSAQSKAPPAARRPPPASPLSLPAPRPGRPCYFPFKPVSGELIPEPAYCAGKPASSVSDTGPYFS
ncbi:hypothetical protein EVAR_48432_1 [Eumeta japonica]|uniref:Uncharacterized protein n=1 Tax=Eumeta variegata TaxID=151549 RepID=A0A4C1XU61_EUMVA|nr:hypothetical protein EVAR_48432_1 [Eumeta japonica]